MADLAKMTPEPDPVLAGLQALLTEFKSHKERLAARVNELKTAHADGKLEGAKLSEVVIELYSEVQDTALSFQEDVTRIVYMAFAEADGEADEEEDDDEPLDDDIDSLLLPGDAAMLHGVVTDFLAVLNPMLEGIAQGAVTVSAAEKKRLESFQANAEAALKLIDEVTMDDGADEGEDDDADEEEPDAADVSEPPAN